jgi:hypothetical protein
MTMESTHVRLCFAKNRELSSRKNRRSVWTALAQRSVGVESFCLPLGWGLASALVDTPFIEENW